MIPLHIYEAALIERINKVRTEKLQNMENGLSADQYNRDVAYCRALRDMLDIMAETKKSLSKR